MEEEIKKEILKLKNIIISLWDGQRDIGTQKLIEQYRIEINNAEKGD